MQSTLSKLASQVREAKFKTDKETLDKITAEREASEYALLKEFERGFAEELPLLAEENITYSAHWNDNRYQAFGSHILFKRGDREVKMDFSSAESYRYEHAWKGSNRHATMTYGNWDKFRFYLFLDDHLIQKI